MRKLFIGFDPTKLPNSAVEYIGQLAIHAWDNAPTYCNWLVDLMQPEQIRRLKAEGMDFVEVMPAAVPVGWSNKDLAQALLVITALSYSVERYEAGRFIDKLVYSIARLAVVRLERP